MNISKQYLSNWLQNLDTNNLKTDDVISSLKLHLDNLSNYDSVENFVFSVLPRITKEQFKILSHIKTHKIDDLKFTTRQVGLSTIRVLIALYCAHIKTLMVESPTCLVVNFKSSILCVLMCDKIYN